MTGASLHDGGWYRNGSAPQLRLQAVAFLDRKASRCPIDLDNQFVSEVKYLQLAGVSAHYCIS